MSGFPANSDDFKPSFGDLSSFFQQNRLNAATGQVSSTTTIQASPGGAAPAVTTSTSTPATNPSAATQALPGGVIPSASTTNSLAATTQALPGGGALFGSTASSPGGVIPSASTTNSLAATTQALPGGGAFQSPSHGMLFPSSQSQAVAFNFPAPTNLAPSSSFNASTSVPSTPLKSKSETITLPILFSAAATNVSDAATINEIKEIYTRFNRDKLGEVDKLVEQHGAKVLLEKIKKKYMKDNAPPPALLPENNGTVSAASPTKSTPITPSAHAGSGLEKKELPTQTLPPPSEAWIKIDPDQSPVKFSIGNGENVISGKVSAIWIKCSLSSGTCDPISGTGGGVNIFSI